MPVLSSEPSATGRSRPGPAAAVRGLWARRRATPLLVVAAVAGLAWWVVGFLPWQLLGFGGRFVGDELGGDGEGPAVPLPLPLTTGLLGTLTLGALVGGAVAGLTGRLLGGDRRWSVTAATLAGMVAAGWLTVVLTTQRLAEAAPGRFASDPRVVAGLVVGLAAVSLTTWLLGATATFGSWGLACALALLAGTAAPWLTGVVFPVMGRTGVVGYEPVTAVAPWAAAGVLAVALVRLGAVPRSRFACWPLAVAMAWCVGPLLTVAGYVGVFLRPGFGATVLADAVAAGTQVLFASFVIGNRMVVPWLVAVAAALAYTGYSAYRGGSSDASHPPGGGMSE